MEKLEFALFKLERVTDEYYKYASSNQQSQAEILLIENKTRGEIAIKECKQYLDREEILSQIEITNLSIDEFFDGSSYSSSPKISPRKESVSEILDIKGSTKSETTFIIRRELIKKELLDTTEKRTEKDNTVQVLEKLNKNKGKLKLPQQNQKILDTKKYPIEPDIIVRPSTFYFVPQNRGKHFNENRHKTTLSSTPLKSKNEKYKQRNSTPFHNPVNTSFTSNPKNALIPGKEPIDAFIDNLTEGKESIIQDVKKVLPTSLLLQREFETRDLPTINLMRFDDDSKQWPNFIQNFKHCVHNKTSFSDSVCLNRLSSVLDGETNRTASEIEQDGLFYASTLKLLKREFGNQLMVSYMQLKEVLERPPIQHDNQNSLRNYHSKTENDSYLA